MQFLTYTTIFISSNLFYVHYLYVSTLRLNISQWHMQDFFPRGAGGIMLGFNRRGPPAPSHPHLPHLVPPFLSSAAAPSRHSLDLPSHLPGRHTEQVLASSSAQRLSARLHCQAEEEEAGAHSAWSREHWSPPRLHWLCCGLQGGRQQFFYPPE